jgi:hypothetical protein
MEVSLHALQSGEASFTLLRGSRLFTHFFVFSSVSSGKLRDITLIRPRPLPRNPSVIVLFNAVAKITCRWSPILFPKLVPDLVTGIQNTDVCQERNTVQIHSERTYNKFSYSVRLWPPPPGPTRPPCDSRTGLPRSLLPKLLPDLVTVIQNKAKKNPITGLDRPWGFQENKAPRFSAYEGGKVVSPTHRPPLPPGNIPGAHFC